MNKFFSKIAGAVYAPIFYTQLAIKSWDKLLELATPDIPDPEKEATVSIPSTVKNYPVIYGTREVAGTPCFVHVKDPNDHDDIVNDLLYVVIVWGIGPCTEVLDVKLDGVSHNDQRFTAGDGRFWLNIENHTGSKTATASQWFINELPGVWTHEHKLQGLCYSAIRMEWKGGTSDEQPFKGYPNITAVIKGRTLVPIGGGIPRYSENSAEALYDYMANPMYGCGIPLNDLNEQKLIAAVNMCNTTRSDGKKLFTCNAVINTGNSRKSNLEKLRASFRANLSSRRGDIGPVIETDSAPVFAFNEDNIIGEPVRSMGEMANRFNRLTATYTDSTTWKSTEVVYPSDAKHLEYLEQDNYKLLEKNVSLPTCTNEAEALQYLQVLLLRSRYQDTLELQGIGRASLLEVGDVVTVTHSDLNIIDKQYRVQSIDIDQIQINLIEHQPSIYPWGGHVGSTPIPPITPPSDRYYIPQLPASIQTSVVDNEPPSPDGTNSTIFISAVPPAQTVYDHGVVRYKLDGDTWTYSNQIAKPDCSIIVNHQAALQVTLEFRGISNQGLKSDWGLTTLVELGELIPPVIPNIENLGLQGGGTQFIGNSPTIYWTDSAANALHFAHYQISIIDAQERVLNSYGTRSQFFTYDLEKNINDGAGRSFKLQVMAIGRQQQQGQPASITISNPAPEASLVSINTSHTTITLHLTSLGSDLDFSGHEVYLSDVITFPRDNDHRISSGLQTSFTLDRDHRRDPLEAEKTYYIDVVPLDSFGPSDNVSKLSTQLTPLDVVDIAGLGELATIDQLTRDNIDEFLEDDTIPATKIDSVVVGDLTAGFINTTLAIRSEGVMFTENDGFRVSMGPTNINDQTYAFAFADGNDLRLGLKPSGHGFLKGLTVESMSIVSGSGWKNLTDRPYGLEDLSQDQAEHLNSIAPGATVNAPTIGMTINQDPFTGSAASGEAYTYGYDAEGNKKDARGKVLHYGEYITVTQELIYTGTINQQGYIVFDTEDRKQMTIQSAGRSLGFAMFESGQWYYDNNSTTRAAFTPDDSYVIIGRLTTGSTSDTLISGEIFQATMPIDTASEVGATVGATATDKTELQNYASSVAINAVSNVDEGNLFFNGYSRLNRGVAQRYRPEGLYVAGGPKSDEQRKEHFWIIGSNKTLLKHTPNTTQTYLFPAVKIGTGDTYSINFTGYLFGGTVNKGYFTMYAYELDSATSFVDTSFKTFAQNGGEPEVQNIWPTRSKILVSVRSMPGTTTELIINYVPTASAKWFAVGIVTTGAYEQLTSMSYFAINKQSVVSGSYSFSSLTGVPAHLNSLGTPEDSGLYMRNDVMGFYNEITDSWDAAILSGGAFNFGNERELGRFVYDPDLKIMEFSGEFYAHICKIYGSISTIKKYHGGRTLINGENGIIQYGGKNDLNVFENMFTVDRVENTANRYYNRILLSGVKQYIDNIVIYFTNGQQFRYGIEEDVFIHTSTPGWDHDFIDAIKNIGSNVVDHEFDTVDSKLYIYTSLPVSSGYIVFRNGTKAYISAKGSYIASHPLVNVGSTKIQQTAMVVVNAGDFTLSTTNASTSRSAQGIRSHAGYGDSFVGFANTAGSYAFRADRGEIGPFTGAHDGLIHPDEIANGIVQGDIVIDDQFYCANGISSTLMINKISTKPMQKSVCGVYVSSSEITDKYYPTALAIYNDQGEAVEVLDASGYHYLHFNALGEGLMNVCSEGGDIKAGDKICSSSTPGKGMRQNKIQFEIVPGFWADGGDPEPGHNFKHREVPDNLEQPYTVAVAREDVNFSKQGEVKAICVFYKAG